MDKMDYCAYFKSIEADPSAIAPPITVRQFQEVKLHLLQCDKCWEITEKLTEGEDGPENSIEWGIN